MGKSRPAEGRENSAPGTCTARSKAQVAWTGWVRVAGAGKGKEREQRPIVTLGPSLHPCEPHFLILQKWGPLKLRSWKHSASYKVLSTNVWSKGPGTSARSLRVPGTFPGHGLMHVPPLPPLGPGHLSNNTLYVMGKVTQATAPRTPCAPSLFEATLPIQEHTAGLPPEACQSHLQFRI